MAPWMQHLINSLVSVLSTLLGKILFEKFKTCSKFPKINVYANLFKNEENRFFFTFYSKVLNKDLLIIKLNIENLSLGEGKFYDVQLFMKRNYQYNLLRTPLPLTTIQKDETLNSFLKSDTFAGSTFFESEILLTAKDKKQIFMVFDATDYLLYQHDTAFSILYKHSSRRPKIKKFKSKTTYKCMTKHLTISEIIEFKQLYLKQQTKIIKH